MLKSLVPLLLLITALHSTGQNRIENSLEEIIGDMTLPHDGIPSGVPSYFDWSNGPRINLGNNPGKFKYFLAWGHVYVCEDFESSTSNMRIQIKDIKAYYLSNQDLKWHLIQSSPSVDGADFIESYIQNSQKPSNKKYDSGNLLSVKIERGYNFHFWAQSGRKIIPEEIRAIFTTVKARLVPSDQNKPFDVSKCPILLGMGGDYWIDKYSPWSGVGVNNDDAGIGRLKCVTRDWKSFNMTTLSKEDAIIFPPPLE